MRIDVNPSIAVLDPLDREIESLLDECGIRATRLACAQLPEYAHPVAHPPDAIIVDLRGGKSMPAALSTLKRQHAHVGILVVAASLEPKVMLEAMRAGANEFLTEPVSARELVETLKRLMAQRVAPPAGQVFAFIGAKGGVGTTTAAVNVATVLAGVSAAKTLVVDLHLANGDAAVFLGAEPRFSIMDALENTHRFDDAFFRGLVATTKAGPHLLASSERVLPHSIQPEHYRLVVDFAARLYRYVILDVPRSDPTTLDALDAATSIVIMANQELSTVRSASRLGTALRQRYGKERVRVVVSRFDKQAEITPDDVERVVGGNIRHIVPSDYRLALQAMNRGRPLCLENHNKISASFRHLAHDLAGVEASAAPRGSEPTSIFGRLTSRS
jgi:pilus assembly protein CpaE